jgi:hypothetical protein
MVDGSILARCARCVPIDRDQPRPRGWLLDEISGVTGWTSILKLARDNTAFGGDTVIATGSRWAADRTSRATSWPAAPERVPGGGPGCSCP